MKSFALSTCLMLTYTMDLTFKTIRPYLQCEIQKIKTKQLHIWWIVIYACILEYKKGKINQNNANPKKQKKTARVALRVGRTGSNLLNNLIIRNCYGIYRITINKCSLYINKMHNYNIYFFIYLKWYRLVQTLSKFK